MAKPEGYEGNWSTADIEEAYLHWHIQVMEYITTVGFAKATKEKGELVNKMTFVDNIGGLTVKGATGMMSLVPFLKVCVICMCGTITCIPITCIPITCIPITCIPNQTRNLP